MSQTPNQKLAGFQVVAIENINPETGVISDLLITDAPAYTAMNQPAYPYLSKNFLFKENLFKDGSIFGAADVGIGDIEADNTDGFFDQFRFFGFDGRRIKIYWLESPTDLLTIEKLLFSGTQDYPEITTEKATFHVKNKLKELDVQAQNTFFKGGLPDSLYAGLGAGDPILDPGGPPSGVGGVVDPPGWGDDYINRLDGEENMYGKTKPICFGRCMSVPLPLVNASKEVYACNYDTLGNRKPIYAVRRLTDQGVTIYYGRDYATSALLLAATTGAGLFDTCLAEGLFKLGTKALGDVVADIDTLPIEANNVATVVSAMLQDLMGYEAGVDYSSDDLDAIAGLNPCPIGLFINDKDKVIDLISLALSSVGGWVCCDVFNVFRFGRIDLPNIRESVFTFTDDYIKQGTLERVQTGDKNRGVPAHQITIRHTKNWQTLSLGQSLQSVDKYYRLFLAQEYRSASATDNEILEYHPSAPSLSFDTALIEGQRVTIINSDFSTGIVKGWTDISTGLGAAVTLNASGQLVLTPGSSGGAVAGISQDLFYPASALSPGNYKLGLTSVSGNNLFANIVGAVGNIGSLHLDAGFPITQKDYSVLFKAEATDFIADGNGKFHLTLQLKNERNGVTQIHVLDNVYIQEYLQGLTATQEAQRRLNALKADVERFTFIVPVRDAIGIRLGMTIGIFTDRFQLDEQGPLGTPFKIIGKVYDTDAGEIQFDVWG